MCTRHMQRICIVFVLLMQIIVCYGEHVKDMYKRMTVKIPELTLRDAELTNIVSALIIMSGCLCETNKVQMYTLRDALCFSLNSDKMSSVESVNDKWWNVKVSGQYKNVKVYDVLLDILKDERRVIVTNDAIMIKRPISYKRHVAPLPDNFFTPTKAARPIPSATPTTSTAIAFR